MYQEAHQERVGTPRNKGRQAVQDPKTIVEMMLSLISITQDLMSKETGDNHRSHRTGAGKVAETHNSHGIDGEREAGDIRSRRIDAEGEAGDHLRHDHEGDKTQPDPQPGSHH